MHIAEYDYVFDIPLDSVKRVVIRAASYEDGLVEACQKRADYYARAMIVVTGKLEDGITLVNDPFDSDDDKTEFEKLGKPEQAAALARQRENEILIMPLLFQPHEKIYFVRNGKVKVNGFDAESLSAYIMRDNVPVNITYRLAIVLGVKLDKFGGIRQRFSGTSPMWALVQAVQLKLYGDEYAGKITAVRLWGE